MILTHLGRIIVEEDESADIPVAPPEVVVQPSNTNARRDQTITIDEDLGEVGLETDEIEVQPVGNTEVFMHDTGVTVESIYSLDDTCKFNIQVLKRSATTYKNLCRACKAG